MTYTLVIGDNFHTQDAAYEHEEGTFPTASEAVAAAQWVIERSLAECLAPGMTAERLLDRFRSFGEITSIFSTGGEPKVRFDSWEYARQKAADLTRVEGE
jgi:hypothetical protein